MNIKKIAYIAGLTGYVIVAGVRMIGDDPVTLDMIYILLLSLAMILVGKEVK